MKNIKLVVLTCESRLNTTLPDTLESILLSDWNKPITVVKDSTYTKHSDKYERLQEAFRGILSDFVDSGEDYLLYLEDDVTVNKHIYHNLQKYDKDISWLLLCNFGGFTGSQGVVLSRSVAIDALKLDWNAPLDHFMPDMCSQGPIPPTHHKPSLVQHNGGVSSITGEIYSARAEDFDENYIK